MTDGFFHSNREAALALLNGDFRLTPKAGQFLGQIAVRDQALSRKQEDWLLALLENNGLPPLIED